VSFHLPELIELDNYENDWDKYFIAVYNVFHNDFVVNKPIFRGKRLGLKKHPEFQGKSATFWHMISEGKNESERIPDIRRCERIGWPFPIIINSNDSDIRCWSNIRNRDKRIILWLVDEDYVVILTERKGYLLPLTAYLLKFDHTRRKMEKEYKAYIKAGGSPQ